MKNITKILLVLLVAIAIALIIWINLLQVKPQDSPIVGGDKDAHGCLGSAGYSWCETKQKCLRVWEEACQVLNDVYPTYSDLKWSNTTATAKTINEPLSNVVINGYEITATGTIDNNMAARKFFDYYDQKLKDIGYATDNNFAADGVLGSQQGYQNGGNYVVLSYKITPGKVTSGENEPLQWTCPCDTTYTIFTGTSETGKCATDSDCPQIKCIKAPCPVYKCINSTCQLISEP